MYAKRPHLGTSQPGINAPDMKCVQTAYVAHVKMYIFNRLHGKTCHKLMAATEMGHLFSCPANVYRAPKASGFQEDRAQRDGEAGERRAGCHTTREPCAPGRSRRGVPPGGRGQGTGTVSPYLECRVSAGERVCLGS